MLKLILLVTDLIWAPGHIHAAQRRVGYRYMFSQWVYVVSLDSLDILLLGKHHESTDSLGLAHISLFNLRWRINRSPSEGLGEAGARGGWRILGSIWTSCIFFADSNEIHFYVYPDVIRTCESNVQM